MVNLAKESPKTRLVLSIIVSVYLTVGHMQFDLFAGFPKEEEIRSFLSGDFTKLMSVSFLSKERSVAGGGPATVRRKVS